MTIEVITTGRTDVEDYFEKSGIRETRKLKHTPFLVFLVKANTVEIKIVDCADRLLGFPDDTQVMVQWSGRWRSDFFHFTVGQFREYIAKAPPKSYQIV